MNKVLEYIKSAMWWLPLFILIPLPYCVVYFSGLPIWIGRTVAIGIVIGFATIGSFWFASNLILKHARPDGKPCRLGDKRPKMQGEVVIGFLAFLFGVFASYHWTIPYVQDVYELVRRGSPAVVNSRGQNLKGTRRSGVIRKPVRLIYDGQTYSLMFSLEPKLTPSNNYEFWILPRSKMILFYE